MNVVHVGLGPISQSDVDLAQACGACIVGFNIRSPPASVTQAATRANIKVQTVCYVYYEIWCCSALKVLTYFCFEYLVYVR